MIQKHTISSILIILLLACFLSPVSAGAENDSVFKEQKNSPDFIATRGIFPEAPHNSEPGDYSSNPLYKCWSNMTETGQLFGEFENYVIGLPYSCSGFIIVELESDQKEMITEATLDDIYQILDDYCENEGISDVPVVFMWSHREESISLPDYGPHIFEEAKKEPAFIAALGTMPVITDEGEKREWTDLLVKGSQNSVKIDHYFLDGPVIGFGTSINGYLFVEFDYSTPDKVNETLIDEIYQAIDTQCELVGISDVPVVFLFADITVVDELPDEEVNQLEIAGLSGKENEDDKTTKNTPGFTSALLIVALLLVGRKKMK
jgi:hypothetical protein